MQIGRIVFASAHRAAWHRARLSVVNDVRAANVTRRGTPQSFPYERRVLGVMNLMLILMIDDSVCDSVIVSMINSAAV